MLPDMSQTPPEQPMEFYLNSNLMIAFEEVGAKPRKYNSKEICEMLKAYLDKKPHLIDKENRFLVNCKDDLLGQMLQVDRFEFKDIRELLRQNIVPAMDVIPYKPDTETAQSSHCSYQSSAGSSQRKSQLRLETIKFSFPEVPPYVSETETDYTYQGYETALCNDDSSASEAFSPYHGSMDNPESELEPVSDDDDCEIVAVSDSEAESFICGIIVADTNDELDEDFFADESDSSPDAVNFSSEDEKDLWPCLTCGISNRPFVRYCEKCWKERKEWFPERRVKKKRRKSRPKKDRRSKDAVELPRTASASTVCLSQDSGIASSIPSGPSDFAEDKPESGSVASCSTSNATPDLSEDVLDSRPVLSLIVESQRRGLKRRNSTDNQPHKISAMYAPNDMNRIATKFRKFVYTEPGRSWCSSNRSKSFRQSLEEVSSDSDEGKYARKFRKFASTFQGRRWLQSRNGTEFLQDIEFMTSGSETEEGPTMCTICCCRVADSAVIHGNVSHMGFCYPCAKRLYTTKSRCPGCRRRIQNISKMCFL